MTLQRSYNPKAKANREVQEQEEKKPERQLYVASCLGRGRDDCENA